MGADPPASRHRKHAATAGALVLEDFLPYRLSVLSNLISKTLAQKYGATFELSQMEWRAMAILGRFPDISANQVAAYGAMDKVAVSRAIRSLRAGGRVIHRNARDDRRRSVLRLSAAGRRVYEQVAPIVMEFERALLDSLSEADEAMLDGLLSRLTARAQQLAEP